MKSPILNLRSPTQQKPRLFDVIVERGRVAFEVKRNKNDIETLEWDDLVYQVEVAKKMFEKENK